MVVKVVSEEGAGWCYYRKNAFNSNYFYYNVWLYLWITVILYQYITIKTYIIFNMCI